MAKLKMSVSVPGKMKATAMRKGRFASKSEVKKSYWEEQEEMHKRVKRENEAWRKWKNA
ncbi:MAG: hypothetical protein ABH871_09005 [Pseudomonadota bacterium]